MRPSVVGMFLGVLLAMLLMGLGTWGAFLTGVLFAVIGAAIGLVIEGRVDLGAVLDQDRRRSAR
jgi:uncharacterized membrane protein